MDLINWPFFWSVTVICITVYNVIQLKLKHELKVEALRSGKIEELLEAEFYE